MPLLQEMGAAARRRREDMGLSQQQVADLAGLSRVTVNELETGRLKNLSSLRIERLANELGFAVGVLGTRRSNDKSAMQAAARVASVPYTKELPPPVLLDSLSSGAVPPSYIPQMRTLLQEAPVAILAEIAEELQRNHGIAAKETWRRMRVLAQVLQCHRGIWQRQST